MTHLRWPVRFLFLSAAVAAFAGSASEDWDKVVALDAGPQGQPKNVTEARALAGVHLDRQESALRGFISGHATDEHAFEAQLRLVRLLEIRGGFQNSEKARAEAKQLLESLEKSATPAQMVEVDFARVTRLMRGAQKAPAAAREELLAAARKFQVAHPEDRRLAALLTEVASLFDTQPKTKTALLNDANLLTTDPELKVRIADDLRRIDLLNSQIKLSFTSVQGKPANVEEYRGRPVVIVFFADFSPPSMDALARVQHSLAELPKGSFGALGVSLDPERTAVDRVIKATGLTWPVAFDGKSWEGELVRGFGINSLPTVWLLDKQGRLRVLNALENTGDLVKQIARE